MRLQNWWETAGTCPTVKDEVVVALSTAYHQLMCTMDTLFMHPQ
jgi:hypothetical protein